MGSCDDPFRYADRLLEQIQSKIVFVDFHAEASSEKVAFGCTRRARHSRRGHAYAYSTADETVLPKGTAYITDVGMTGPYDSVIGVKKELVIERFLSGMPARFEAANGDVRLCGVLVECDDQTGRASRVERLMLR